MSLLSRITALAENSNISLTELERILGFGKSSLRRWDSNMPSCDKIMKVSAYFNVSTDYLLYGKEPNKPNKVSKFAYELVLEQLNDKQKAIIIGKIYEYEEFNRIEEIKNNASKISLLEPKTVSLKEEINIPEYIELKLYTQRASAGIGKYNYEEDNYEVTKFDISKYPQAKKADHVIIVEGDSLSSTIEDGQYIFVREQAQIEPNEIGVFVYKDTVYCKRLHIDRKKRKLSLVSDNTYYKNIEITNIKELRTIGKVIL